MTITQGKEAEAKAKLFLQRQGLRWVASNFRCKSGELDLVMLEDNTLVFVEVRSRSHPLFASAAQSVDTRKQRRLGLTASHFLKCHNLYRQYPCRFDVIAYDGDRHTWNLPRWIKRAFVPPLN